MSSTQQRVTVRERGLKDRLMARLVPRPIRGYRPRPVEVTDGLWTWERRLRHFGAFDLPTKSVVLRMEDGGVALLSPPPLLDEGDLEQIAVLGPVVSLFATSSFHYLYLDRWRERFPAAAVVVSPGLAERTPAAREAREVPPAPEVLRVGRIALTALHTEEGLSESLVFDRLTKTLVLTDLAFHVLEYPRSRDRAFWRFSGIPGGFAPGRTTRQLLLSDAVAARLALRRALEWPFERIVVSHGEPVTERAREAFEEAFRAWLEPPGRAG